ncbi:Gfo/Idh/MocA family protein [Burkholderia cenocepacia]|uniref:Gfo/Idh/MocA family protein n=1 Tax=Burkholderia cenocepacia TaxID=95486 RepID=UPI002B246A4F|nr:Gfo/Idh/MocA family oxidoreductase [Burkholderia cenocepacia]MEB2545612.1 Gfo/Idh/MocA family oxidoreductase [Burkholderia cenocepacia]
MTGKRNLTAAIIGAGMIGEVHLRAARLAGARIAGIVASTPERTSAAADRLGVNAYPSADAAIDDPAVDVLHICTPNATHHRLAMAALAAGKHVICEKPLAIHADQAAELAAAAVHANRVATVPFVYRYHPMVREARARVREGRIGALHMIHGSYLQDWLLGQHDTNWRVDPGAGGASRAFADIGSHWCDLVEWVSGERLASVVACLRTAVASRPAQSARTFAAEAAGDHASYRSVETEDVAGALFTTAHGVPVSLAVSQVSAGRKNRLWFEMDGAEASVVFDQEDAERLWVGTRDAATLLVRDPTRGSAEQRRLASLPAGHAQGYAQCFEAFVGDTYAEIRGERRDGLPTFEDGARSATIVDAVLASSREQNWQRIG